MKTFKDIKEEWSRYILRQKEMWLLVHKLYSKNRRWGKYLKVYSYRIMTDQNLKLESVCYFNY